MKTPERMAEEAQRWKLQLERFRLDLVDPSKLAPEERREHSDALAKVQHMLDMIKPRRLQLLRDIES